MRSVLLAVIFGLLVAADCRSLEMPYRQTSLNCKLVCGAVSGIAIFVR